MKQLHEIQPPIIRLCQQHLAVMAAYVFGSVAQGKARDVSDIDVAILLDKNNATAFSLLPFITQLEETLGWHVDVVVLNSAGELLKYEVRRTGTLIFERSSRYRKQFEIMSRKAYEDFLYLHRRYVKAVLYAQS